MFLRLPVCQYAKIEPAEPLALVKQFRYDGRRASVGRHQIKAIFPCRTPTLLISSAKDRLLGSLQEGARLERVMANAMRVVLPRSGHTALLEVMTLNLVHSRYVG